MDRFHFQKSPKRNLTLTIILRNELGNSISFPINLSTKSFLFALAQEIQLDTDSQACRTSWIKYLSFTSPLTSNRRMFFRNKFSAIVTISDQSHSISFTFIICNQNLPKNEQAYIDANNCFLLEQSIIYVSIKSDVRYSHRTCLLWPCRNVWRKRCPH